nr:hypothetical protein [Rhizobium leguminosarum]
MIYPKEADARAPGITEVAPSSAGSWIQKITRLFPRNQRGGNSPLPKTYPKALAPSKMVPVKSAPSKTAASIADPKNVANARFAREKSDVLTLQ